jgi:hypothetical protein
VSYARKIAALKREEGEYLVAYGKGRSSAIFLMVGVRNTGGPRLVNDLACGSSILPNGRIGKALKTLELGAGSPHWTISATG